MLKEKTVKDCNMCRFHKAMISPKKGVKIPGRYGKCIRPEGHCDPDVVPDEILSREG